MIIPGQFWTNKLPLVSILADTRVNGFPTAKLDNQNYSLRLRYEVDPLTGQRNKYDFNEKSALVTSNTIGGIQDRDEREHDFGLGTTFEDGFNEFVQKYRDINSPTICDGINYSELHVFGGYIAARTEYGFAVKHPDYPVAFIFEACEDVYDTYLYDMCQSTQKDVCEFEFEPKQVWGALPDFALNSQEAFKNFLYTSMTRISNHLAATTPGAMINLKSKGENTKEHLEHNLMSGSIAELGLTGYYRGRIPQGYTDNLTSLQSSLMMGRSIETTLLEADPYIAHRCSEMHYQKLLFNKGYDAPDYQLIQKSSDILGANDNSTARKPEAFANRMR